jgi:hypothetical protein
MTDGTKGSAQRASSLRPRCVGEVDPETVTHIYLQEKFVHMRVYPKIHGICPLNKSLLPFYSTCTYEVYIRIYSLPAFMFMAVNHNLEGATLKTCLKPNHQNMEEGIFFYVVRTVHIRMKLYNDQRNAQVFNSFIYLLLPYMFRAFF